MNIYVNSVLWQISREQNDTTCNLKLLKEEEISEIVETKSLYFLFISMYWYFIL
jgi:hypothetical protein